MKGIEYMAAGLMMLVAASCTKSEAVQEIDGGGNAITIEVTPSFETSETKTVLSQSPLIRWGADDAKNMALSCFRESSSSEGVYYSHCFSRSSSFTPAEDYLSAVFSFSADSPISENHPMRAIYPYSSGLTTRYSVVFDVAASQTQGSAGENTFASASVPMVSDIFNPAVENGTVSTSVSMHVLSSVIAFYVYDSKGDYRSEKVTGITLSSDSGNIAGETKITDITTNGEIPVLTGSVRTADVALTSPYSLSSADSKESSAPIYLSVVPSSVSGEITVKTDKALYFFTFTEQKTFNRAEVKDFYLNLSNEKVERVALSSLTKPVIGITHLSRTQSGSYNNAVLTIKKGNDAVVGFYALMKPKQNEALTRAEVLSGDVYHFGDADSDEFALQSNGTVLYKKRLYLYSPSQFSFAVVPFDKYGNLGNMVGDYGYGNSTRESDLDL